MVIYIKESWLVIGLLISLITLFGNNKYTRFSTNILFLIYMIIASNRGIDFNNDTHNYFIHFSSFFNTDFNIIQLLSWGWEVGYNCITIILTRIFSEYNNILFFLSFLPSLIFAYSFYKYKYHPIIISFIYSTIVLVTSVATIRHWWALSITFLLLNYIIVNKHRFYLYFVPIMFHYSTIPISLILLINRFKNDIKFQHLVIVVISIIVIISSGKVFLDMLYNHFIDRAISGGTRLIGFRNIINMIIFFLIIISLERLSIKLKRLNFLLLISFISSIILMPFYGINRIVSFFTLILIVDYNQYNRYSSFSVNNFILYIINLVSLIYFYQNSNIQ